jgi:hypothetical protein
VAHHVSRDAGGQLHAAIEIVCRGDTDAFASIFAVSCHEVADKIRICSIDIRRLDAGR